MKKLSILLAALLLTPFIAFAVQISVPSTPWAGMTLVSNGTGNYVATTTDPFHAGSFYATSTASSTLPNAKGTGLTYTYFCFTGDICRTTWPTVAGSASSTLLTDNNTFSGVNKFSNASSDFSGTWQTFSPSHFQTALGFTPYNATNPSSYIALTALSATWPLAYNNSTGVFSSATSSGSSAGVLSAADWTTFNNKGSGTVTSITATSPLTGGAITSSGSIGIQAASASQAGSMAAADYQKLYTATSTFTSPLVYTLGTNAVTCPTCITSLAGAASSTLLIDHNTFAASTTLAAQLNLQTASSTGITTQYLCLNGSCLSAWPVGGSASSTLLTDNNTFSGKDIFSNATSTLFSAGTTWFTGITGVAGNCLHVDTNGKLSGTGSDCGSGGATAGYPFPLTGNATSTLTQFNGGLTAYASSTIGNGTQAGGLTISGGATTTGNMVINSGATGTTSAQFGQATNPACVISRDTGDGGFSYTWWKAGIMYVSTTACNI